MVNRYDEDVTFEDWRAIKERDEALIAENEVGFDAAGDDLAENA